MCGRWKLKKLMLCVWNVWTDDKLLFGLNFRWRSLSLIDFRIHEVLFLRSPIWVTWLYISLWRCWNSFDFSQQQGGSESHSIHCPTKTAIWDCDIGTGHPDVPATTLLFGKWLTEERPCRSVYFAGFFATWTISVNIQNEHDVFVFSSFARLRYNIILRRYSDYYVLRASFILLNLVCYVWLGFSSHWIPLWIHFQSSVWNAWRDVKLVLLVFPSNNFQLQRDTAFHWDCVQRSYQWHGISTWTYLRSDFRFLQMWRRLSQELRGGVSTVVAIWDHLRSSQYFYLDFELSTSAQPSVQLPLLRIAQSYIPEMAGASFWWVLFQWVLVTFLMFRYVSLKF